MHQMPEIACVTVQRLSGIAPVLTRLGVADASALKPPHEAGRRGGDSIARGTYTEQQIVILSVDLAIMSKLMLNYTHTAKALLLMELEFIMTGNVPATTPSATVPAIVTLVTPNAKTTLTEEEFKSLNCLFNRLSWSVARSILTSLGFTLGRGKDATFAKVHDECMAIKEKDASKFATLISKINDILFGQFFYGDKALFSLKVDASTMSALKKAIDSDWQNKVGVLTFDNYLLNDLQLSVVNKNKPELLYFSSSAQQAAVLFSSVREEVIKEKVAPQSVPQYQNYDEIIAKKKVKRQCFDVCLFDFSKNLINIMIDAPKNVVGETITFSKSVIVQKLYDYVGGNFSSTETDFFPLIDHIFDQKIAPFINCDYQVFELSFYSPEGTTHQEKKKDVKKDLRDDVFNQVGIQAVGQIGVYKIGIRVSRKNANLMLDDELELVVPGTLRRYLNGSSGTPVNYVIINNCLDRNDFKRLMNLIV
ncbi:hypothetical protein ACRV4U_004028 [Cronobacter sakazakii]